MQFVTAANYRHKALVMRCQQSIESFGYSCTVFDLGGLGFGRPFPVKDETFQSLGYYATHFKTWRSRGMHKPNVVAAFLADADDLVIYLDADAVLRHQIDEIEGPYDVGVTTRHPSERIERIGRINSGVLFVYPTAAGKSFVAQWQQETLTVGNDQMALNHLVARNTCRICEFSTFTYNWYYFPKSPPSSAKVSISKYRRPCGTTPGQNNCLMDELTL